MKAATQTTSVMAPAVFVSPFLATGIIMLGAPCCGKGTQANNLKQMFGATHISSGAVLLGNLNAKPFMDAGLPVPDEHLFPAIEAELGKHKPGEIVSLIEDGWVRHAGQVRKAMELGKLTGMKRFIALEYAGIPKDELIRRMVERAMRQGRTDDKLEVFEDRLDFYEQNKPLISNALTAIGCPVGVVQGYDHPDTVFMNMIITLRSIL